MILVLTNDVFLFIWSYDYRIGHFLYQKLGKFLKMDRLMRSAGKFTGSILMQSEKDARWIWKGSIRTLCYKDVLRKHQSWSMFIKSIVLTNIESWNTLSHVSFLCLYVVSLLSVPMRFFLELFSLCWIQLSSKLIMPSNDRNGLWWRRNP